MFDIYVISKTELTSLKNKKEPRPLYIGIRNQIRPAEQDEIDSDPVNVFTAYKVRPNMVSVLNSLPPGRWVIDFDGSLFSALRAVGYIGNDHIEMESAEIIEFTQTMPILIRNYGMNTDIFGLIVAHI